MVTHLLAVGTTDSVYDKTEEVSVKVLTQINSVWSIPVSKSKKLLLCKTPKSFFILTRRLALCFKALRRNNESCDNRSTPLSTPLLEEGLSFFPSYHSEHYRKQALGALKVFLGWHFACYLGISRKVEDVPCGNEGKQT